MIQLEAASEIPIKINNKYNLYVVVYLFVHFFLISYNTYQIIGAVEVKHLLIDRSE